MTRCTLAIVLKGVPETPSLQHCYLVVWYTVFGSTVCDFARNHVKLGVKSRGISTKTRAITHNLADLFTQVLSMVHICRPCVVCPYLLYQSLYTSVWLLLLSNLTPTSSHVYRIVYDLYPVTLNQCAKSLNLDAICWLQW